MRIFSDGPDNESGRTSQKGAGDYTLCEQCNNTTGQWYGPAYADWAYQGLRYLAHAETAPSLYLPYRLFPVRVLKQIVCMFFSVNLPSFREAHPELVKFVLDRQFLGFPSRAKVFVATDENGAHFHRDHRGPVPA